MAASMAVSKSDREVESAATKALGYEAMNSYRLLLVCYANVTCSECCLLALGRVCVLPACLLRLTSCYSLDSDHERSGEFIP